MRAGRHKALWIIAALLIVALPVLAHANSCAPAASAGTAPSDFRTYCWLDFTGYNDTEAQTSGQPFTFNLPDGSTVTMTVSTQLISGGYPYYYGYTAIRAAAVPSWRGAAFGNSAFLNIPGLPVLYETQSGSTVEVTLSNIHVIPPSGGTALADYAMVVADGESTNTGESNVFTTNGNPWVELAKIPNGTYYPTISGVGTQTVTETGTQQGSAGSFVFGSLNNPTQISFTMHGGGLQGVVVGVRYASVSVVSSFNGARINPADQITYSLKTELGSVIVQGSTSGTASTGFTPASIPTIAASYPFVLYENMAAGSVDTLANYDISLTCVNDSTTGSSTVLPKNYPANQYTIKSLQYGDAVVCNYINTPIAYPSVSGYMYDDSNHNGFYDSTDSGVGLAGYYVHLTTAQNGVCAANAVKNSVVNSTTGSYTLDNIAPGDYCLILNASKNNLSVTPSVPSGWVGTQNGTGVIYLTVNGASGGVLQNFGFYHGSEITGIAFDDNGAGGGTANDGVQNGSEATLAGAVVTAASDGSTFDTEVSSAAGTFSVWVPYSIASSASNTITLTPVLSSYLPTWGSVGNTGGAVQRVNGAAGYVLSMAVSSGVVYSGVQFGFVPQNSLTPNSSASGSSGAEVFFSNRFIAGSSGSVSFSVSSSPNPPGVSFAAVLYQDTSCSGTISASDPIITQSVPVTSGQTVCLLVKEVIPASAQSGATDALSLSALETYSGSTGMPNSSTQATDTVSVTTSSSFVLSKVVTDVTTGGPTAAQMSAAPGNVLEYIVTATNNGAQPASSIVINDTTPSYTTFNSAACPASLPAGITACSVSVAPASGGTGQIQWTLAGELSSGASVAVTYEVTIAN